MVLIAYILIDHIYIKFFLNMAYIIFQYILNNLIQTYFIKKNKFFFIFKGGPKNIFFFYICKLE